MCYLMYMYLPFFSVGTSFGAVLDMITDRYVTV